MPTNPPSQALMKTIIDSIIASPQQRLTFAEYMDLVLYHPQYGYYASGTGQIGSGGDFFTSPSLGADFGELLAEQLVEMWEVLGKPEPFTLLEMGAGSGVLASDILQYLENKYYDFFQSLEYLIIEKSKSGIVKQQELLNFWIRKGLKLSWKSWLDIPDNKIVGCLFSNELIDAFPVHRIIIEGGKIQEIFISFSDNKLLEIIGDISTPRLANYFNLVGINLISSSYPTGYRTEVNLAALDWVKTVAKKLKRGYLLTIDYGYPARKYYHTQRNRGTLQCYYQHRCHNNPYLNIGSQDITTHVDFTALERQGEMVGLKTLGFTKQGMFLMALGLGNRLSELANGQFSFQQVLQRRDALHQLINPTGLGGFGVLIQSKGLEEEEEKKKLKGIPSI